MVFKKLVAVGSELGRVERINLLEALEICINALHEKDRQAAILQVEESPGFA